MNRLGKFIRFVAVFVAACLIVSVSPDIVKVKAGDYYTLNGKEIGKYSDVDRVQADGVDGTISFNPDLGMIVQVYGNNLTKINIPATINGVKVRSIADWAIQYKENVTELTLPEGIEIIGDGNFRGLKVKKIVIPGSVSSIGNSTFSNSDYLEEVVFEDGKSGKTLGDWSLQNCPALKSVYFGEGFVTLGQGTGRFDNKLETVHFPTTIKTIGNYSFKYCINLENVSVGKKSIDFMHEFGELGISLGDYPFTQCYFLRKDFSPSYKTSKWYTAVHELKLTGDYAKDIISIARSQIGYHEGNTFDEQHGNNSKGSKDFAEYNYFYGDPGTMWCGEFVDWCYAMAGVPDELYSLTSSENEYDNKHKWSDTVYAGGSYRLKPGDVIMFIADGNKDHVIMVESIEDSENNVVVHSVDGNHSQAVVTDTWRIEKKTGRCLDYNYDTNGHVDLIYGPDWNLADTIRYYNVRFDANGGKSSVSSKKVSNNAYYGILPIPVRSGYTFEGWYTAAEGGNRITAYRNVNLTGDVTLYAHWSKGGNDTEKITGDNDNAGQNIKISIKASKTSIKKSSVKKKAVTINITVTGNKGKVTFQNASSEKLKKYVSVSSDGKVIFKKGASKGTYKIKVSVKAAEGQSGVEKTIKIKVK